MEFCRESHFGVPRLPTGPGNDYVNVTKFRENVVYVRPGKMFPSLTQRVWYELDGVTLRQMTKGVG